MGHGYDYDLFVIGAGSGGVRAARMSAGFGARVAICEDRDLGGTCVNLGCVPKKLLVYSAHYRHDFEDAEAYGWTVPPTRFDWKTLIANKDREIARLNGVYGRILAQAGVEIIEGRGVLLDPHTVSVGDRRVTAEHILVATGSWPRVPDEPGAEHAITSNEVFHLDELPRRVVVVGGGYIGVELACILNGLGAEVTLVYRGEPVLRGFDDDVRRFISDQIRAQGVDLRLRTLVKRLDKTARGVRAPLTDGTEIEADAVICAVGRAPKTAGLGLEAVGVELGRAGEIPVDDFFRTRVPSVLAVGDVIARKALTPVALAEGMAVAQTLFGGRPTTVDYENIATTVFSTPAIGTVGLTEAEARAAHGDVDVYRSDFTPLKHTLTGRPERTLMKLIVDRSTDRVLGCHVVSPDAGEIISGFAVALKMGATKAQLDATIGVHPTAAEELVTMRTPASS